MAKKKATRKDGWQIYDEAFKWQSFTHGQNLLTFLGYSEQFAIVDVTSPSLRIKERRMDTVYRVKVNGHHKLVLVECQHSHDAKMSLRLLIMYASLRMRYPDLPLEVFLLELTGGTSGKRKLKESSGTTQVIFEYEAVALADEDAKRQVEQGPVSALPFVSLMRGADLALLTRASQRIIEEVAELPEQEELLENFWVFTGIRFSEEEVMAVRQASLENNSYLNIRKREREEVERRIEQEREELERRIEQEREEAERRIEQEREEAKRQLKLGLEQGQRQLLLNLICHKYPKRKPTTVAKQLAAIKSLSELETLSLRVLKDLSWQEFWKL